MGLPALAAWLVDPLHTSAVLLALAALVWLAHWRRSGLAVAVLALGWSLLWSLPGAAAALRDSLQQAYLGQSAEGMPQADVIVVLGGGIGRLDGFDRGDAAAPELDSSRVAIAARAWHAGRAPVILVSGGRSGYLRDEAAHAGRDNEAELMAAALQRLGVPAHALVLDPDSADTRGNAEHSARIARERGWRRAILVTTAMHMPRALRWFDRAGLPALPLAAAEPATTAIAGSPWQPSRRALRHSGRALREYAGLLAAAFG